MCFVACCVVIGSLFVLGLFACCLVELFAVFALVFEGLFGDWFIVGYLGVGGFVCGAMWSVLVGCAVVGLLLVRWWVGDLLVGVAWLLRLFWWLPVGFSVLVGLFGFGF